MKITICIGSSCHLKGSRHVVDQLHSLTDKSGLAPCCNLHGHAVALRLFMHL